MWFGAVHEREVRMAPRSQGLFVARAVYCGALLGIVVTCWLVVTGTQAVATAGDTARFAATLFRILAPLQLALAVLVAALASAVAVGAEKDRRTLELLLVSRLDDWQLVVGKLTGSLLRVLLLLVSAVPVFALAGLFGGVTAPQIARMFAVTAAAALAAKELNGPIAKHARRASSTADSSLFLCKTSRRSWPASPASTIDSTPGVGGAGRASIAPGRRHGTTPSGGDAAVVQRK